MNGMISFSNNMYAVANQSTNPSVAIEDRAREIIEKTQRDTSEPIRHYNKTLEALKKMGFDVKPIFPQKDFRIVYPNHQNENRF